MSGIKEIEKLYRDRINNVLHEHPELKGYVNFLNDVTFRTQYAYLNIIARFIERCNKKIEKLDFDDFNNYISDLKYNGNGESKTQSYLITVYSAMKRYCEYLSASKKIPENYMLDIKRPKYSESQDTIQKRENGYLNESEMKKMLKHSQDNTSSKRKLSRDLQMRNQAIIYLFLGTGIRCSALTTIDIDDLDLDNKIVTVTEKGNKIRTYELSREVCDVINLWLTWRKAITKDESKALFITKNGERIKTGDVYYIIKNIAKNVTDKNISPHKLRASYGTQLYNITGDIYFVQDCMGHNSPQTTERYIRGKKENTKRASDIMAKMMR